MQTPRVPQGVWFSGSVVAPEYISNTWPGISAASGIPLSRTLLENMASSRVGVCLIVTCDMNMSPAVPLCPRGGHESHQVGGALVKTLPVLTSSSSPCGAPSPCFSSCPCLPLPDLVPQLPSQGSPAECCWQRVHPAWPPGCQGNVTNAAGALSPCQDTARAGCQRQNFQTTGYAVPLPTRCLPKHHMAPPWMNFHVEKRLCYMSLRPQLCSPEASYLKLINGKILLW